MTREWWGRHRRGATGQTEVQGCIQGSSLVAERRHRRAQNGSF